jgi:hypothetical protein
MSSFRAVASALLLAGGLLQTEPAAGADGGHGVALGPAAGESERFSTTSPVRVAALRGSRTSEPAVTGVVIEHEIASLPDRGNRTPPARPLGANERMDSARFPSRGGPVAPRRTSALAGFDALSYGGMSPPDPVVAAGPQHVVVAVNSAWAVYTKTGSLLFKTTAGAWFLPQLAGFPSLLPYDPQVAYDHFRDRWLLVYSATDTTSRSWLLLSVSASSDPTGPWYSWALRGDANGSTAVANFSDYPALGYDDAAIYIATNQFRYSDRGFAYARIRVLDKNELYAGSSQATWSDFWDLEDPASPGTKVHSVRPARTFGSPGVEYLVSNSPFVTRTFVTLWSLSGAGTAESSLSAFDLPVAASLAPPRANQEGGSPGKPGCPTPCLIDTGGGNVTSAVYRNGSLWFSQTVADSGGAYSRARYARIGVAARTLLEDEAFGSDGCWYFYPAVAVDAGNNLSMVFGRSCTDAFAGVALTGRTVAEEALEGSVLLKDGEASYVAPIGSAERINRWGDFFGTALDPVEPRRIWVVGEYAGRNDLWRTWVGETGATLPAGSCLPEDSTLCLGKGRFRVTASWRRADGTSGTGRAVPITDDTGYFWFFDAANIEVVTKVLDACGVNARYWVFSGGLTNLEVSLDITDTRSDLRKTYTNPAGTPYAPVQDTLAFQCP